MKNFALIALLTTAGLVQVANANPSNFYPLLPTCPDGTSYSELVDACQSDWEFD